MTSLAAEFFQSFQAQKQEITEKLHLSAPDITEIHAQISRLRKSLVDATPDLPPYDQRQCDAQLKALELELTTVQASAAPKPRFAFKRAARAPKSSLEPPITPPLSTPDVQAVTSLAAPSTFQLSISDRRDSYLTLQSLDPHNLSALPHSSSLSLSGLDSCILNLLPTSSSPFRITALHIRDLKRTILIAPSIEGSLLIHNCENCIIIVGCHQFRMHTSHDTHVYLHVASLPVIEHCSTLYFSAYPTSLPLPAEARETSKHASVQDFDWIKSGPSPNWSTDVRGMTAEDVQVLSSVNEGNGVEERLGRLLPRK